MLHGADQNTPAEAVWNHSRVVATRQDIRERPGACIGVCTGRPLVIESGQGEGRTLQGILGKVSQRDGRKGSAMDYTRGPRDHQGLPRHCHGKDHHKHYNPNADRFSQILGKEDRNCAGDYQLVRCSSHTRCGLGQEQKGRDRICLG